MLSQAAARRGAINLNNCGVILLTRRRWSDALDTFKDALHLMKSVANEQGGAVSEQEMQLALHKAWQRTAITFPAATQSNDGPILKVISSQCNPANICAFLNRNGCHQDTKFLVTIDPIDFEDSETDVTDLEAATILYNFGISHRLLSFCGFVTAYHQDNSYPILQVTQTLAYNLFRKAMSKNKPHLNDPIMLINLLLTLSLVVSHDGTVTSEHFCEPLEELVFLIHSFQKWMPVVDHKFAPAA